MSFNVRSGVLSFLLVVGVGVPVGYATHERIRHTQDIQTHHNQGVTGEILARPPTPQEKGAADYCYGVMQALTLRKRPAVTVHASCATEEHCTCTLMTTLGPGSATVIHGLHLTCKNDKTCHVNGGY